MDGSIYCFDEQKNLCSLVAKYLHKIVDVAF